MNRWRHILYPCLGHRILGGDDWRGRHVPLISWLYYASAAWSTPRLPVLAFITLVPAGGLMYFGIQSAANILGVAFLSLLIAGWFITTMLRPRLEVATHLPARVPAGSEYQVQYTVDNKGHRAAFDVEVETLPFPYLLELRSSPAWLHYLPPGRQSRIMGSGRALKRGRYLLQPMRWSTDFPFGLWRRGKTDWSHRTLNVYPAFTPLQTLNLPEGASGRRETHSARHLTREALEFHGCREFRAGDLVRHIHPRSSARLGFPVVKEFKADDRGRTALAIDTWRQHRWAGRDMMRDPVVEASLSLAAAIADYLARTDNILELLVAGPRLHAFESAGRQAYLEQVLDILAAVEPCRDDSLDEWAPRLLEEIREIQQVIVLLGRWDEKRAAFVQSLRESGVGLKVVLVHHRRRPAPNELPADVLPVSTDIIHRGEVHTL